MVQETSGHTNLEQLQKYLEVKPKQVKGAVAALSMLSHAGGDYVFQDQRSHSDTPSR